MNESSSGAGAESRGARVRGWPATWIRWTLAAFAFWWMLLEPLNMFNIAQNQLAALGVRGYGLLCVLAAVSGALIAGGTFLLRRFRRPPIGLRLLRTSDEVIRENVEIVESAKEILVATGSRSRDKVYLNSIERKLADNPRLQHYRVLFGPPHNAVLRQHLLELLRLRDPEDRTFGHKTLYIALFDNYLHEPERFVCANESRALVVLPSVHGVGRYDTALLIEEPELVQAYVGYVRQLYAAARPLEKVAEVRALSPIRTGDPQEQRRAPSYV